MELGDDKILVERVRKGDHAAFRRLVERYQERVFAIAIGIVRNEDDAMDITQDAFVKVYRYLDGFRGTSSFYTWLYRIVVNLCIDHGRRLSRASVVDFDDTLSHPDASLLPAGDVAPTPIGLPAAELGRKELRNRIGDALERLTAKHREVIVLREIQGLSYNEISEVLSISVGTVMSRLHHARQNMQTLLKRYVEQR